MAGCSSLASKKSWESELALQKYTGDSCPVLVNCTVRKGNLSKPISPVVESACRRGEGGAELVRCQEEEGFLRMGSTMET